MSMNITFSIEDRVGGGALLVDFDTAASAYQKTETSSRVYLALEMPPS